MNYTLKTIGINDSWFNKKGKILKIGVEGFNLFFNLFRFRVHGQEDYYTCITSINLLAKELKHRKYTREKIFDLLMNLKKLKVIELKNVSNPAAQLKKDGKVDADKTLIIVVKDIPDPNKKETKEERQKNNSYVLWLSFDMIEHLQSLDERYLLFYALISKYSKGIEGKCNINIENMPDYIPLAKDTCHNIIFELNELQLLSSDRRVQGKKLKYEHRFCPSLEKLDQFVQNFGSHSRVTAKRGAKRKERLEQKKEKAKMKQVTDDNVETDIPEGFDGEDKQNKKGLQNVPKPKSDEDMDIILSEASKEHNQNEKLAFGHKPSEKKAWGTSNPFDKSEDGYEYVDGKKYQVRTAWGGGKEYFAYGEWMSEEDFTFYELL